MTALIPYDSEILHRSSYFYDFNDQPITAKDLANTLLLAKGSRNAYGLAAPQIGVPYCVFAFLDEVAFNPKILEYDYEFDTKEEELFSEGCLSYPGLWIQIKRPPFVKVSYQNVDGTKVERWLGRLESRVFQHEYDHLEGITMVDKASDLKLRRAIQQANKHGQKYTYSALRSAA
jgi:peptide deformylase